MTHLKIAAALMCALGIGAAASAVAQHAHEPVRHAVAAAPVPARRWTPDAPLRLGMRRVFVAVDALRHYEMGHMSAPMAVDRAGDVEQAVSDMFAHCKLAAEPDAALHGVLLPLLGAAQALKADPQKVAAVADMRAAIANYPTFFNDPGWDKPAPVEHAMRDEP